MTGGQFPVQGPMTKTIWLETTWNNDTLGVALMTIGTVLLMRNISSSSSFYHKIVLPVSKASYGMYLAHMLILSAVSSFLRNTMGTGADGVLGVWTTGVQILLTAIITFTTVAIASILIQRIPRIGKYIVG